MLSSRISSNSKETNSNLEEELRNKYGAEALEKLTQARLVDILNNSEGNTVINTSRELRQEAPLPSARVTAELLKTLK